MVFEERYRVDGVTLVDENYILAITVCLRAGEV
jgi:hypothetical protein